MHNIEPTDSPAEDGEEFDYITSIAENVCSVRPSDKRDFAKEIYSEMLIDDKSVIFQVDCGSSINIIPKSIVDKHMNTHFKNPHHVENGSHATWDGKNYCHEPS